MNKKFTKLLSVFILAGVIGTGAAFAATGCKPMEDDPHQEQPQNGVTSVTVKAAGDAKTVANGGTLQMTAEVVVTGTAAQTVKWSIKSGATATGATIDEDSGLLSAGTVAGEVTVVATSTVDNTKKGGLK